MNDANIQTPDAVETSGRNGEPLDGQILEFVGDSQSTTADERRIRQRYPISCKMHLMPWDSVDPARLDGSWIIFGKDLSRTGICFTHDFPLPHRRLVISLVDPILGQFVVEAEVAWTRTTLIGLYESGCRLIRKISGHQVNLLT